MSSYKEYFAIESRLKNQGFDVERSDIILQFSNGKKKGLSQLTHWEYKELLVWLNLRFSVPKVSSAKEKFIDGAENLQRRKIIALFAKMGYVKEGKSDMYRINGWCMNYGHLHKMINDYHGADLTKLVSQAEQVYKTFIEGQ